MTKRSARKAVQKDVFSVQNNVVAMQNGPQMKRFSLQDLAKINPLTENQKKAFEAWRSGKNLFLGGSAGCGKSFLGMFLGLESVLDKDEYQEQLVIVRSAVETRRIGFLPGTEEEKYAKFEAPYHGLSDKLFKWKKSYENMKDVGLIDFNITTFLRGVEFDYSVMLVDEIQNMDIEEIDTVMTRVGVDTRIIITGDGKQDDLKRQKEASGYHTIKSVCEKMDSFEVIEFTPEDSVRSQFIREYLRLRGK